MPSLRPVNPPETPIDTLRSLRRKPETRTGTRPEGEPADSDYEPRYVDVPRHRRAQLAAERNLKWGLAVMLLALGLIGAALIVSGPRALVPVVICLVTFTILWTMVRLRVFHQRNSVFFAAALVCLLGATIPMIERGYVELDRMAHSVPAPGTEPSAVAAQKAPELPPVAALEPESDLPSLVDALKVPVPSDEKAELIRIVENTKVLVGRKAYMLNAGDTFVLEEIKNGQAIFRANEMRLAVPESAVEQMSPAAAEPAAASATPPQMRAQVKPPRLAKDHVSDKDLDGAATARAHAEAMRRYPAIANEGSVENEFIRERFLKLKKERPEFFDEEEWPLFLAEGVAKEQGWQRVK